MKLTPEKIELARAAFVAHGNQERQIEKDYAFKLRDDVMDVVERHIKIFKDEIDIITVGITTAAVLSECTKRIIEDTSVFGPDVVAGVLDTHIEDFKQFKKEVLSNDTDTGI